MKNNLTNEKGITLVALIITIIILVILAAVSIRAAYNSGIINLAVNGTENYIRGAVEENDIITGYEAKIQRIEDKLNELEKGILTNDKLKLTYNADMTSVYIYPDVSGYESENYQIEITFNGETESINLADTDCAKFTRPSSGKYNVYVEDVENSITAEMTIDILAMFYYDDTYYDFEKGMTWGEFIESSYNQNNFFYLGFNMNNEEAVCGNGWPLDFEGGSLYVDDIIIENEDYSVGAVW